MTKPTKRADGRWQMAITVEGRRKYFYGATAKEVKGKVQKAQLDIAQGRSILTGKQTLRQFMERWFEDVHRTQVGERWYLSSKAVATNHIYPALGHLRLDKLSAQHIQALYTSLGADGLAPRTIHQIHALLHKALEKALDWELVRRNESNYATLPRKTSDFEAYALSPEEAKRLVEAARKNHMDALIQTAITTGLRRGELCALLWSDVDFEKRVLHVRRNVIEVPGKGHVVKEPKTKTSKRDITLPTFLVATLRAQQRYVKEMRLQAGATWQEHNLVFPSQVGAHQWRRNTHERYKAVLAAAGLPDTIRFHDLRHSAATLLRAQGVDLKVIQEILGHSSITVTGDVYSHTSDEMHERAAGKMDELFGS